MEKLTIDCEKKSPNLNGRISRKQTLNEKSPSLKKSLDFSISLINKKISDKGLFQRTVDRISKK